MAAGHRPPPGPAARTPPLPPPERGAVLNPKTVAGLAAAVLLIIFGSVTGLTLAGCGLAVAACAHPAGSAGDLSHGHGYRFG